MMKIIFAITQRIIIRKIFKHLKMAQIWDSNVAKLGQVIFAQVLNWKKGSSEIGEGKFCDWSLEKEILTNQRP